MSKEQADKYRKMVSDCEAHIAECVGTPQGKLVIRALCARIPGMQHYSDSFYFGAGGAAEINSDITDGPTLGSLNGFFGFCRAKIGLIDGEESFFDVLVADSIDPEWRTKK